MPGIEMSITMTSGFKSRAFRRLGAVAGLADDGHVALGIDQELQALPDGDVVVSQEDA